MLLLLLLTTLGSFSSTHSIFKHCHHKTQLYFDTTENDQYDQCDPCALLPTRLTRYHTASATTVAISCGEAIQLNARLCFHTADNEASDDLRNDVDETGELPQLRNKAGENVAYARETLQAIIASLYSVRAEEEREVGVGEGKAGQR